MLAQLIEICTFVSHPNRAKMPDMTRTVGQQQRTEFILDPAQALRRCRVLDAMLAQAMPAIPKGVMRAPHRILNQLDDARQLAIARRLNPPCSDHEP